MSRSRAWCFTVNNYTDHDVSTLRELGASDACRHLVFGRERGSENGTLHLQGYAEFRSAKTFSAAKAVLPLSAHLEQRRGNASQAANYCKKDGDYEEFGEPSRQGTRSDLDEVRAAITAGAGMEGIARTVTSYQSLRAAECLLKYMEPARNEKPFVSWFSGGPGLGKSRRAFFEAEEKVRGGNADRIYADSVGKWFEGYDGHRAVIIDDLRPGAINWEQLLRMLDRYPNRVEYKGGSRQFLARYVWITSCHAPYEFAPAGEDVRQLTRRIDVYEHFTYEWTPPVPSVEPEVIEVLGNEEEQVFEDDELVVL